MPRGAWLPGHRQLTQDSTSSAVHSTCVHADAQTALRPHLGVPHLDEGSQQRLCGVHNLLLAPPLLAAAAVAAAAIAAAAAAVAPVHCDLGAAAGEVAASCVSTVSQVQHTPVLRGVKQSGGDGGGGGGGGAVPPAAPLRALVSPQAATCASDNCHYPFGPAMQLEQVQGVLRNALLGAAAAAVVAGGLGPEGSPALPAAWAGIGGGAVTNAKASKGWAGVHAAAAWEAVCGAELSGRAGNGNGAHVPGAVGRQM